MLQQIWHSSFSIKQSYSPDNFIIKELFGMCKIMFFYKHVWSNWLIGKFSHKYNEKRIASLEGMFDSL